MNTEQERAEFEAWYEKQMGEAPRIAEDMYTPFATACWEAYQAGRAALQSPEVVAWKRDSERYRWLLRNYLSFNLCDEAWKHGSLDAAFDAAMEVKP